MSLAHQIAFVNRYHKNVAENPANAHVNIAYPKREFTSERSNFTTLGAPNRLAPAPNQKHAVTVIEIRGVVASSSPAALVVGFSSSWRSPSLMAVAAAASQPHDGTSSSNPSLGRGALRPPIGV